MKASLLVVFLPRLAGFSRYSPSRPSSLPRQRHVASARDDNDDDDVKSNPLLIHHPHHPLTVSPPSLVSDVHPETVMDMKL